MIRIPMPVLRGRQYSVRFTRFGRDLRLTAPTPEAAQALWMAEYLKGETVDVRPPVVTAAQSVKDMVRAFMDEKLPLNGDSDERQRHWKDRTRLELMLSSCSFVDQVAMSIRRRDLRELYRKRLGSRRLRGRGRIKPSTANKELEKWSSIFQWAIEVEWGGFDEDDDNPAAGIEKVTHDGKRDRVFHDDERERLFAALKGHGIENIALCGYYSGMRLGEILRMRYCDLQGDYAIAEFSRKGSDKRRRLMPDAIEWIKGYIERQVKYRAKPFHPLDRLFPWYATESAASHAFARIARQAGLHDFRFHDLRHVRATIAAEAYGDVWQVMAVTGHKSIELCNDYVNKAALSKKFDERHK
jgi:integrase